MDRVVLHNKLIYLMGWEFGYLLVTVVFILVNTYYVVYVRISKTTFGRLVCLCEGLQEEEWEGHTGNNLRGEIREKVREKNLEGGGIFGNHGCQR
jgi:hypothetical protein